MGEKIKWTDQIVSHMIYLLGEGFTASKISTALNDKFGVLITRNAIIGKSNRLREKGLIPDVTNVQIGNGTLEEFKRLWSEGVFIHEIAERMGINKKTVARKVKEYNLPDREKKKKIFSVKGDGKPQEPKFIARIEFPNPNARSLSFLDVGRKQCRFILGEGKASDFLYCGADVPDEYEVPYCPVCKPIVYIKPVISSAALKKIYR